ncbi:Pre-toxin domain with VENN motif-containing protein [Pasteurella testudinis DSM 23072]|uniref:Pre-toxin domain with VENN motif-containing protein n=1 Tax=Pasteurella testudinis DSM 23072 TaxID=1122938 RepID=A0A1W1UFZ4_9PAST|nr:Pre-toxin domain with VENN motif-containing protein [Pasteurella testudinis DSM 23072]SUB50621.1 Ribonuclease precursor [Pasteurella testudinis]
MELAKSKTSSERRSEVGDCVHFSDGTRITATKIGGAITSTQRDKNRLATNQFTFTDIENRSESKAVSASIGVSASSDLNKDENGKVIKNDKGEPERVTDVSPTGGLPMFSRTQDNSTTQATLSEGTIILNKDSSPMKTTAAALGINTDSGKGNAQTEKPKDINTTLATQKAMQSAVADISAGVSAYSDQQRKTAEVKKADAAQAMANAQQSGNQAAYEQAVVAYAQADSEAKAWGTGGSYQRAVDTATKVITLAIANGNSAQLTATALSPLANQAIKDATTDENGKVDKTTNLILHGILGAVEAQVNGGSALGGAAAAMTGEATADLLAKAIYNKTADQLDERERANISSLSSLTGALAATVTAQADGTATDSTTTLVNAATGKAIAESAVENNSLSGDEFRRKLEEDKERYKQKVRDELGNNTASQLINGVINVIAETGDFGVLALDGAFDASAALITCAIGDSYCGQAKKDLASKNQGAVDALNSLMNGDSWNAIKSMANNAYYGDQTALENLSGILTGIAIPIKNLPKGVSANEKLPVVDKTVGYPITEFNHQAHNAAIYEALKLDLKTQQAANHLIDSLKNTGKLPDGYMSKEVAKEKYGWLEGKPVKNGQIGGDIFKNKNNLLPNSKGRIWFEADIGIDPNVSRAKQPGTRLIYSNDGMLFITTDHYNSFKEVGKWK